MNMLSAGVKYDDKNMEIEKLKLNDYEPRCE